jgi:hypothetical protein
VSAPTSAARWFDATRGEVNRQALAYVRSVDAQQAHVYNKFIRCAALYDMPPRPRTAGDFVESAITNGGRMHENVIASAVDTVSAQIATTDIRAVFDTDGADWSTQRKARHREWYSEQLGKLLDIPAKLQRAFKSGTAVKGTGAIKVYIDAFDQIRVDTVMVDDIVVDELECRNGPPRQMHYRTPLDKEELKAQFPSHAVEIDRAQSGTAQNPRLWAGYRLLERHEVMVLESWKLPIGTYGHERYKPGRHTIVIDGCDLLDEEYDDAWFPIITFRWEEPTQGWYGIGLVERNAGLQRALNRRNLQIERQNDQGAFPTTWIHRSDAALRNQAVTQNAIGTVAMYGGAQPPTTVIPQAVSQQTYMDADRLGSKIFENTGISRMAAQSVKPAGIETGVALREYRDQTTQRFARQEKGYERFYLDVMVLVLDCCRKLGTKAPRVMKRTRFGSRKLSWTDVDMTDVRIQIGAASTVSRSRAGRLQSVVEWAQAGIISQDTARRLLNHPDLEREMSLYTAAIENVEACLEEIADGAVVMPEPFMNLKLLVWRAQQQYLNWSADGAPEEILENLRTLIVQAAWMVSGGDAANENAAAGVGPDASMAPPGASGPGGGAPPGAPPPMPPGMPPLPGMPMDPHPQAAFSPQAMQLSAWG